MRSPVRAHELEANNVYFYTHIMYMLRMAMRPIYPFDAPDAYKSPIFCHREKMLKCFVFFFFLFFILRLRHLIACSIALPLIHSSAVFRSTTRVAYLVVTRGPANCCCSSIKRRGAHLLTQQINSRITIHNAQTY